MKCSAKDQRGIALSFTFDLCSADFGSFLSSKLCQPMHLRWPTLISGAQRSAHCRHSTL